MGASLTRLLRFNDHGEDFLEQIITGDETWVHQQCPERNAQSMKWKHPGSPNSRHQPAPGNFYQQGFEKWISCLDKCLNREGDCVEK
jgi:hypothetical protein